MRAFGPSAAETPASPKQSQKGNKKKILRGGLRVQNGVPETRISNIRGGLAGPTAGPLRAHSGGGGRARRAYCGPKYRAQMGMLDISSKIVLECMCAECGAVKHFLRTCLGVTRTPETDGKTHWVFSPRARGRGAVGG